MKYVELDDKAKQRARDWMLEGVHSDDLGIDELISTATMLGFAIDPLELNWSVDDGVAFSGHWYANQFAYDKLQADWPEEKTLAGIGAALMVAMLAWPTVRVYIEASSNHGRVFWSSYMHPVEVEDDDEDLRVVDGENVEDDPRATAVTVQARALANWMHDQVKAEWEYRQSDENLEENIICNDYDFDEDGHVQ
jgi:hypothetical protein